MKLGVMKEKLPASLAEADKVYCFTAGLGWDAQSALGPLGSKVECHEDLGALVSAITSYSAAGDHVLVMSNGGFQGVHQKLLAALAARPA
jgi:UDP-N-acetylmuramate: L-alanyl-gamma-D-glutamyl-meso-diaminopimelate ligase